jgi:hypothetical protein
MSSKMAGKSNIYVDDFPVCTVYIYIYVDVDIDRER